MVGEVGGRPLPTIKADALSGDELAALSGFELGHLLNEIALASLELSGHATQATKNLQIARVRFYADKGTAGELQAYTALEVAKAELAYVRIRANVFRQFSSIIQTLTRTASPT
jgi:hypothetical protein